VLLTRLPLGIATSFDLHVLGTPPALVLSQDQTLHNKTYGAFENGSQTLMICTKSLDQEVGDPQTFALAALFSFQGANPNPTPPKRVNRPRRGHQAPETLRASPAGGTGQARRLSYHAKMACQGMSARELPAAETAVTVPLDRGAARLVSIPAQKSQRPTPPGRFPAKGVANAL
jgi:hypothetical protein